MTEGKKGLGLSPRLLRAYIEKKDHQQRRMKSDLLSRRHIKKGNSIENQ